MKIFTAEVAESAEIFFSVNSVLSVAIDKRSIMEQAVRRFHHLALLKDIDEISNLCSTRTYIWAGLVRDIWTGEFLRDHGDVDGFVLNLWELREEMASLYRQRGYTVTFLEEVHFLKIERDGVHAMFNRLEFDGETAMWRHVGDMGTVYFPKRWLSETPRPFYDTHVFVSGLEFEYAIKACPRLLSPEWHGRDKDRDMLAWLARMLDAQQINREDILKQVWSYTPYWVQKGYDEYAAPVKAWRDVAEQ